MPGKREANLAARAKNRLELSKKIKHKIKRLPAQFAEFDLLNTPEDQTVQPSSGVFDPQSANRLKHALQNFIDAYEIEGLDVDQRDNIMRIVTKLRKILKDPLSPLRQRLKLVGDHKEVCRLCKQIRDTYLGFDATASYHTPGLDEDELGDAVEPLAAADDENYCADLDKIVADLANMEVRASAPTPKTRSLRKHYTVSPYHNPARSATLFKAARAHIAATDPVLDREYSDLEEGYESDVSDTSGIGTSESDTDRRDSLAVEMPGALQKQFAPADKLMGAEDIKKVDLFMSIVYWLWDFLTFIFTLQFCFMSFGDYRAQGATTESGVTKGNFMSANTVDPSPAYEEVTSRPSPHVSCAHAESRTDLPTAIPARAN
jgi:hypothetical protein